MSRFDINEYSVLQELGGSSKPLKLEHKKTKKQYCLKKYQNMDRMMSEYCGNRIYKVCGAPVPDMTAFSDKHLLIEWVDGPLLKDYVNNRLNKIEDVKKKFSQFFLIDCLVANWDVVGLEKDNVIVDRNDAPFRIDCGGCLGYRAMGERKSKFEWGAEFVSETITMKDPQSNKNTAFMFGNIVTAEFLQLQFLHFNDRVKLISKINQIQELSHNDKQIIEKRWKYISSSMTYQQNQNQSSFQPSFRTNNINNNGRTNNLNSDRNFQSHQSEHDELQEAIRRSLLDK